jgi:hypothetical protein
MREGMSDGKTERDGDEEEHDSKQTLRQVHKTAQAPNEDERAVL